MDERDGVPVPNSVRDAAADWLARRERSADAATEARYQRWRAADPLHRQAYDELERDWRDGSRLGETAVGRDRALVRAPFYLRRSTHVAAVVTGVAVLAGVGLTVLPLDRWPFAIISPAQAQSFETAVGEVKTVALADGSRLTLDTNTKVDVRVAHGNRSAVLERGRARFAVVGDRSSPFRVRVRMRTVETTGAEFDVSDDRGAAEVRVLIGRVTIEPGRSVGIPLPTTVGPGQAVSLSEASAPPLVGSDDIGWPTGMIALDSTSIGEAVAAINRYNATQIRLDDPALSGLKISGGFRARDPNGFAQAVAALHGLRVTKPSPDLIVLSPRN